MVFLKFPDGSMWHLTNFAFRRLLLRHAAFFPDDAEIQQHLNEIMVNNWGELTEGSVGVGGAGSSKTGGVGHE
jgi:hypothetical protein